MGWSNESEPLPNSSPSSLCQILLRGSTLAAWVSTTLGSAILGRTGERRQSVTASILRTSQPNLEVGKPGAQRQCGEEHEGDADDQRRPHAELPSLEANSIHTRMMALQQTRFQALELVAWPVQAAACRRSN